VRTPSQKDEHSGHVRGFLIYGILEAIFLSGENISEKLHIVDMDKEIHKKYKRLKNNILIYKVYFRYWFIFN
jgi:hypothetical protein